MEIPPQLGRYHVRRKIGEGGMGVVYEGYDPFIARRVALKAIRQEYVVGPEADEFLQRLKREAQAAGGLNHPNIVGIYDYCEDLTPATDGTPLHTPFIVMEYIEGRELASRFKSHERFSIPEIQRIMGEIFDALRYLHSHGVVHRDIKPGNIILLTDGSVKVADFGIARCESSTLTKAGSIMGSPNYMAPEQFSGQAADGRCDLYAAAVILYQFLTGALPFAGSPSTIMHRALYEMPPAPSSVSADVPREFDKILRRAMAKRPADRFQTAAEFKQAVMAVSVADLCATRAVASTTSPRAVWRLTPAVGAIVGILAISSVVALAIENRTSTRSPTGGGPLPPVRTAASRPEQVRAVSMVLPSFESTRPASVGSETASAADTAPIAPASTLRPQLPPAPESTRAAAALDPVVIAPREVEQQPPPAEHPVVARALEPSSTAIARKEDVPEYRCSDLLQKASLEPLSPKEKAALAKNCR